MRAVAAVALACGLASCRGRAATSCADLKSLSLGDATVTQAQSVAAGPFAVPVEPGAPAQSITLPAFCRVQGVIAPTRDSHIEFEVWLPASAEGSGAAGSGWNGRYQGVGVGAFAGAIQYDSDGGGLASALKAGYATSSTDTGHRADGLDARWALGHPEKIVDYGYRAIHETAEKAKIIIRAFYGEPAKHSYFNSCSNGGRQALMEAQRYPDDYDGIIAGAPAANFTRILTTFIWNVLATTLDPASHIPVGKFAAIEAAAVAACDARDGMKDGILDEPNTCAFDPSVLLCKGPESDACLTSPQITALKKIYSGPRTAKGEQLYPGFEPGGESEWAGWVSGARAEQSLQYIFGTQGAANLIFQNAAFDYKAFNVDRDARAADHLAGRTLNAIDPDLSAFQKRGGKLIVFHGWSDPALPPTATIDYYRSAAAKLGTKADETIRLYMVPGMQHCGGGPGADAFGFAPGLPPAEPDPSRNMSAALERWVELGTAPSAIVATKYNTEDNPSSGVKFTRPLCPYPQIARYKGAGSENDAANFACVAP
jgi:tannase/feruloyl esterase